MDHKHSTELQMLSLLVMDLGYRSAPLNGQHPLRHQIAWSMVENTIDADQMKTEVLNMMIQHDREHITDDN